MAETPALVATSCKLTVGLLMCWLRYYNVEYFLSTESPSDQCVVRRLTGRLASPPSHFMNRRFFLQSSVACAAGLTFSRPFAQETDAFKLNYILSSAMYGEMPLERVLEETPKTGTTSIDIWPRRHGSQREQMDMMGFDLVEQLLEKYGVKIDCITRYDLGPFKLTEEFAVAKRFGAKFIVTGGSGPKGLSGDELKAAVAKFVEQMKPHVEEASKHGVTIVIENHGNGLMESPDSLLWLAELGRDLPLGIEFAPYHLPQDPALQASLIRQLGNTIKIFLAWQYGAGCMKPMPKEEELLQMAGRGSLDFTPMLQALKEVRYEGWTQVFMHPTPRGIPILPTAEETTAEINRARKYLDDIAAKI